MAHLLESPLRAGFPPVLATSPHDAFSVSTFPHCHWRAGAQDVAVNAPRKVRGYFRRWRSLQRFLYPIPLLIAGTPRTSLTACLITPRLLYPQESCASKAASRRSGHFEPKTKLLIGVDSPPRKSRSAIPRTAVEALPVRHLEETKKLPHSGYFACCVP